AHSVTGVKSVKTYLLPKRKVDTCGQMDLAAISIKVQALLIEDHDIHSTNIGQGGSMPRYSSGDCGNGKLS
ncbi:MAG TPA: hypothetical protein VFG29_07710, partial [Syntrophales bacterium]|nr:hypothetical protein [Syntrophales bacterium]